MTRNARRSPALLLALVTLWAVPLRAADRQTDAGLARCRTKIARGDQKGPGYQEPFSALTASASEDLLMRLARWVVARTLPIADRCNQHRELLYDTPPASAPLITRIARTNYLAEALSGDDAKANAEALVHDVGTEGALLIDYYVRHKDRAEAQAALEAMVGKLKEISASASGTDAGLFADLEKVIEAISAKLTTAWDATSGFPGPDDALRVIEDNASIRKKVPDFARNSDPATNQILARIIYSLPRDGYSGYGDLRTKWMRAYRGYAWRTTALTDLSTTALGFLDLCETLFYASYETDQSLRLDPPLYTDVFGRDEIAVSIGLIFFERLRLSDLRTRMRTLGIPEPARSIVERNLETVILHWLETTFPQESP